MADTSEAICRRWCCEKTPVWRRASFRSGKSLAESSLHESFSFCATGVTWLRIPLRFTGAYLVGTLLNNVVVLSGILAICTLLALLWRYCDVPVVHDWIEFATFGRATDFHRAFIPAAVFGLLWLVTRIYTSYTAKGRSLVPTVFFAGFVVSILVGIAVLLGNGDISGLNLVHTQWGGVIWVLAGVLLVGLIPTMRPWLDDTATAIDAQRTGGNAAVVSDPDKQEFSRLYLETKYPEKILNRRRSLRSVSITADQWWRMKVFIVSLAVFIVSLLWIDPN